MGKKQFNRNKQWIPPHRVANNPINKNHRQPPSLPPPPGLITQFQLSTKRSSPIVDDAKRQKIQQMYAKKLATEQKDTATVVAEVKQEVGEQFNLFAHIANRFRSMRREPEATVIDEDNGQDEDEIEIIEEDTANESAAPEDRANMDDLLQMSIISIDEVGGDERTMVELARRAEAEEEDDEILCLGEKQTDYVLREVVCLDDELTRSEKAKNDRAQQGTSADNSLAQLDLTLADVVFEDDAGQSSRAQTAASAPQPSFIPLAISNNEIPSSSSASPSQNNARGRLRKREETRKRKERERNGRRQMDRRDNGATKAASACSIPSLFATPALPLRHQSTPLVPTPLIPLPSPLTPTRIPLPRGTPPSLFHQPYGGVHLQQVRALSTSAPSIPPSSSSMTSSSVYGMPPPATLFPSTSTSPPSTSLPFPLIGVHPDEVHDSLSASGLFQRQWETKRHSTVPLTSPAHFRAVSYNLLCQKTIKSTMYLYPHTQNIRPVLDWNFRWPLIAKELRGLNADVIGVQEIQDVHWDTYSAYMHNLGYGCYYKKKTGKDLHGDGCGLFVRQGRFQVTDMRNVEMLIPGDELLDRGNIAQLARLKCSQTGSTVLVSNTHIIFNERRGDVKLAQIALLMANIDDMRYPDEPIICLGDWNLEPKSHLYNYITNARLDATQVLTKFASGQIRGEKGGITMNALPVNTLIRSRLSRDGRLIKNESTIPDIINSTPPSIFTHQLPLASAYAPYREPLVSTYHKDQGNPDFIFYTTNDQYHSRSPSAYRLHLLRTLSLPPERNIRIGLEPWPNQHVPSDHIPLVADFALAK